MILLDTCALLWLESPSRFTSAATEAIRDHAGDLYVSSISAFEIAVKHAVGKLRLPLPPEECYRRILQYHGVRELPIDGPCASLAGRLPLIHRDPCDRFIIAAATLHDLAIVTADTVIPRYPKIKVIW